MSDQIQEEIDPELTEFSFEDSERVTTIWIDGYADNPEWDEPEWADHPEAYRNAVACGHCSYLKDGTDSHMQCAPDWIPASGIAEIKRCIDRFVSGEINEFGQTPKEFCPGDDMPPFQIAMHRDAGRVFVRLSDNGRHCADHSIEQELTDVRLNELQEYFTRISGYWPPR